MFIPPPRAVSVTASRPQRPPRQAGAESARRGDEHPERRNAPPPKSMVDGRWSMVDGRSPRRPRPEVRHWETRMSKDHPTSPSRQNVSAIARTTSHRLLLVVAGATGCSSAPAPASLFDAGIDEKSTPWPGDPAGATPTNEVPADCSRPGLRCPSTVPIAGSACNPFLLDPGQCEYPALGCCSIWAWCDNGKWSVNPPATTESCAVVPVTGGECPPTAEVAEGWSCQPRTHHACSYSGIWCTCEYHLDGWWRFACASRDDRCGSGHLRGGCACDAGPSDPPGMLGCPVYRCVGGEIQRTCILD